MEISLEDLFYAFIRNYDTFKLSPDYSVSGAADFTHRILDYYYQLGQLLGFEATYERKRYDLSWYKEEQEGPFLHVEHENRKTEEKPFYSVNYT